ncbi:hypothetical protein Tco_0398205 [Tanacetum coccineum]|uniref:Uncharacterized protein n=1 Tax=Tanacetum coccineum TaxID=301880 RepID=A0ABQ5H588_9ASTR
MQNTMAEQNVPAQAPARTDEQIVPRSQWLQIRKSNLLFDAQSITEEPHLLDICGHLARDQAPHDSTTGPSSQPEDDTSKKVVHESSSTTDSERTESGTEAAAPKGDKEQGEVASSTVTSGVGISVRAEDQAGSDPGKAHEALAGPDPEPMLKKDQTGSDS